MTSNSPSKYQAQRDDIVTQDQADIAKENDEMVDDLLRLQQAVVDRKAPPAFVKTIGHVLKAGVEAVKSGMQPDIDNLPQVDGPNADPALPPSQGGQGQGVQLSQRERKVITDLRAGIYELDNAGRIKHPVGDPDQDLVDEMNTKLDDVLQTLGVNNASSDWKHKLDSVKDEGKKVTDLNSHILSDLARVTGVTRAHGESRLDYWNRIKDELTNLNEFKRLVQMIDAELYNLTGEEHGDRETFQEYIMRTIHVLASQRGRRGGRR